MNDLTTMRQLQQTGTMSLSFGRGIGFKTQLDRSRPAAAWDSSPTPVRSIGGVPARPGLRQSTSDGSGSSASSVGVSSGGGAGGGGVGSGASAGIASTGSAGRTRGRWGPSAASAGAQQDGPNTAFGFLNASVGSEPDRNQGRAASSWEGATAANSNGGGGGSIGVNATSAAPASGTLSTSAAALEAAASASMAAAAAATATATGAGGVATPSTAASTSLTATASNGSATPGASGSDTDATGSPARRRPFPLMRSTSSNKLRQEAVRAASQEYVQLPWLGMMMMMMGL